MSAFTAGLPARICSSIPSPMSVKENAAQKKERHSVNKVCRSYWDFLAAFRATSLKSA
jgi:hypothetical protein